MELGFYKKSTNKTNKNLNLDDINKLCSKIDGHNYGKNLVTSRGNVFPINSYDNIDNIIDKRINYLV